MPNVTSVAAQPIKNHWNKISVVVGLVIVAIAGVILYRLLHDIEPVKIVQALREKSATSILIALGCVGVGYVTLTAYDFFALRAIGKKHVPYRIAALASFTSYTIGHNLGATVFTAGVIRYRVYSPYHLGVLDIAKMAFITGLTFWLGNTFVLGAGMAYEPEAASAVNQLPLWVNRAVGLAGLAVIIGYLFWLLPRPRVVGRSSWKVTLPNAKLTFVQIGIGVLDLSCAGLAMYVLLPDEPAISFVTLLVVFVTALLLGFLSHAPGSLGVIEAAMLIALPQFQKEELLASLLIFRFLYFILPLCCAVLLLGLRELWFSAFARRLRDPGHP
jgi:glycosyltransferase 2 family protein